MKKKKKALAVLSAAVMTASMGIFNVSADEADKEVVWRYGDAIKNGYSITCYDDGSVYGDTKDFETYDVVYTLPEGVEPTLEYFNDDRIKNIYEFKFTPWKTYYTDSYSNVEAGENKYVFKLVESIDYLPYTAEEAAKQSKAAKEARQDIAKQLLAEGKIIKAEEFYRVFRQTQNSIAGLSIELDDETTGITKDDLPDLSSLYKVPYDVESHFLYGSYVLCDEGTTNSTSSKITDKATLLNIPEICELILESNPHITNVSAIPAPFLDSINSNDELSAFIPIYMQGDANRNNQIDIIDAVSIAKYLLHPEEMDEETIKLADINNDGTTDIVDAVEIAKKLLEKNKK